MPFITFEGIEGSGKSTQARRLAATLGPDTVSTFEPGATELGRKIRGLLLHGTVIPPEAELHLFLADRAQHVNEVIAPALARHHPVVCDRFLDSTLAYQGFGRGLRVEWIRALVAVMPDLTFFLDVPVTVGLARARQRGETDRFEAESVAFHERVREGYRRLAAEEPRRFVVLDGQQDPDTLEQQIRVAVEERGFLKHAVS